MRFARRLAGLALVLAAPIAAAGAQIKVLWYGQSSNYNTQISTLASTAASYDPAGDGSVAWDLTFWNIGDPTPSFSDYNVLVIGSSQVFGLGFDGTRLLDAQAAIENARGRRTFLSGQDADWHYMNGPGPRDDGPRGFLINAVNWAGSSSGLGIVALADGYSGSGSEWWLHTNSFLRDELVGRVSYFQEESVVIPGPSASFPVNEGLTTAGLSNWGTSAHLGILKDTPGYFSINDAGSNANYSVTLVTEREAGGGTQGPSVVPEPSTYSLIGLGLAFLGVVRRRRAASA